MTYHINLNMGGESTHGAYMKECIDHTLIYRWSSSYQTKNTVKQILKTISKTFSKPLAVVHNSKLDAPDDDDVLLEELLGVEVSTLPSSHPVVSNGAVFIGYNADRTVLANFSLSARMSGLCAIDCELAGVDDEVVYRVFKTITGQLPHFDLEDNPREVKVNFWSQGDHGTNSFERPIAVPAFEDILENYPSKSVDKLQNLIDFTPGQQYGKLVLLHGKPGVGKTYYIRSLMQKWKKQFNFNYLVDPERFFSNASYMIALLSRIETGTNKWNLLISEDVDEFISIDAKQRSGQSLSRLLNLTEGLLGQGTNLLLLMTTNEDIEKLHPAVQRQGRCLANLEFPYFPSIEGKEWLRTHGKQNMKMDKEIPLSDLYSMLTGERITSLVPKKHLGLIDG